MSSELVFFYAGHHHASEYGRKLLVGVHSHAGVELVYVLEGGNVTKFSSGVSLSGTRGTVYVIPPGIEHAEKDDSCKTETIFAVMELPSPQFDTSLRTIDTANDPLLERWFQDLVVLSQENSTALGTLLLKLIWTRLSIIEKKQQESTPEHPALARAVKYIRQYYLRPFSITFLAERVGISYSHLNALFQRELSVGAETYLTTVRMKHARLLLLNPYCTIAEVAEKAGYSDPNYFSRCFRRFHGITPNAYRKDPKTYKDRFDAKEENDLNLAHHKA